MRKNPFLLAAPFLAAIFVVGSASAHDDPAAHGAEATSIAAHQTVSNLRHRWDKARAQDPLLASCLESKVLQAISVAKRVDEHLIALRDIADPKERARRLSAIERLSERRAEITSEALACDGTSAFSAELGTQVMAKASGNIAQVDLEAPEGGFPPNVLWALLRLR
ncbi:MAG: hypothetical protein ACXVEF_18455 [Polyangiales bacterium]